MSETLDKLYLEISQKTEARNARELRARKILKRVWIKLNCGIDNEPDSKIADDEWDYLCEDMGDREAVMWAEIKVGQTDDPT